MTATSIERARLQVPCGALAHALAPRFVRALAAHTSLTVDRVEEAVLLVETVATLLADLLPDGDLELAARVLPDGLELVVGPLAAGIPAQVLAADRDPAVLAGLSGSTEIREGRDGRERLHLLVA